MDFLLENKSANVATPEVMPCYLVIGTFAPALDYLTVKQVREAVMGRTRDSAAVNSS